MPPLVVDPSTRRVEAAKLYVRVLGFSFSEVSMRVKLKNGSTVIAVPAFTPPKRVLEVFQCWSPKSNTVLDGRNGKHIPKDQIEEVLDWEMTLEY